MSTESRNKTRTPQPHVALRQSSIKAAMHCPRLFMFRYLKGLVPRQFKGMNIGASGLGSWFHRLMEAGPSGVDEVDAEFVGQLRQIRQTIAEGSDLLGQHDYLADETETNYRKARAMAAVLWNEHPLSGRLDVLAREEHVSTTLELNGEQVPVEGTVDQIIMDRQSGCVYVGDFKTSSRDVEFTLTGYHYSVQCRLYRVLARQWMQDNEIPGWQDGPRGFILTIAQTPAIKYCSKDRDLDAYIERVSRWYQDKGTSAVRRFDIDYAEPLLPEDFRLVLTTAAAYASMPCNTFKVGAALFPRDLTGATCSTRWNRVCDYYPLCCSAVASWPHQINEAYDYQTEEDSG